MVLCSSVPYVFMFVCHCCLYTILAVSYGSVSRLRSLVGKMERNVLVSDVGWRVKVAPQEHPVNEFQFDVLLGADGTRNTLAGTCVCVHIRW